MMESRLNRTLCLVLIGVALFVSLLPIVLAVMNALKTTVEISTNPLAPPVQFQWQNFSGFGQKSLGVV